MIKVRFGKKAKSFIKKAFNCAYVNIAYKVKKNIIINYI